jgi:hypothetical protein
LAQAGVKNSDTIEPARGNCVGRPLLAADLASAIKARTCLPGEMIIEA